MLVRISYDVMVFVYFAQNIYCSLYRDFDDVALASIGNPAFVNYRSSSLQSFTWKPLSQPLADYPAKT